MERKDWPRKIKRNCRDGGPEAEVIRRPGPPRLCQRSRQFARFFEGSIRHHTEDKYSGKGVSRLGIEANVSFSCSKPFGGILDADRSLFMP